MWCCCCTKTRRRQVPFLLIPFSPPTSSHSSCWSHTTLASLVSVQSFPEDLRSRSNSSKRETASKGSHWVPGFAPRNFFCRHNSDHNSSQLLSCRPNLGIWPQIESNEQEFNKYPSYIVRLHVTPVREQRDGEESRKLIHTFTRNIIACLCFSTKVVQFSHQMLRP